MKRTTRYRRRERNFAHMAAVRQLPCAARTLGGCFGPIECHHAGRRFVGMKCPDTETTPMCQQHHRQFTDHTGPFKTWTREERRTWQDEAIEATQKALSYALAQGAS